MTEFHDWDDIRAELDDGGIDALAAERARTEAWVSAFQLAEERLPAAGRTDRAALGSLAGQVDLSGDWDSPSTNARIATDFGIGG
ncbi:XRE family transcriptional regulator [Dactylosporangium sp. NPDC049525]|uniref:XRE family transcriptional regulator n=1 Tax=Dactylosporangium sp. NPDC049525 TaxID=3154730 RepID=UPI00343A2062